MVKKRNIFINSKLDDVRNGKIILIPKKDINTHHLSGINNRIFTVKVNKLYFSTTGVIFPRKYKYIISNKK